VKVGEGSMAFMFESSLMVGVTDWALEKCKKVQHDYNAESWEPLKSHFAPPSGLKKNEVYINGQ
jgi:homogentisate 1,2-dioxygenase